MKSLRDRLERLETGAVVHYPWHEIIVDGCSDAEAIAVYETDHGAIGEDNIILWRVVDVGAMS